MLKRFKYEEMEINVITGKRLSDILSDGLTDGVEVGMSMTASGVTPEVLFGVKYAIPGCWMER